MKTFARVVCAVAIASGVAGAQARGAAASKPLTVEIKDAQGQNVGTAVFTEAPHGVKIKLDVKGLPAGEHSLHIHQNAKCEAPDFKSAGPHFNPEGHKHGLARQGGHAGDLGNFTVAANGKAKVNVVMSAVTLGSGANSLFKDGGTALVVHEKADDMKTDPAGAAGSRLACGVFTH